MTCKRCPICSHEVPKDICRSCGCVCSNLETIERDDSVLVRSNDGEFSVRRLATRPKLWLYALWTVVMVPWFGYVAWGWFAEGEILRGIVTLVFGLVFWGGIVWLGVYQHYGRVFINIRSARAELLRTLTPYRRRVEFESKSVTLCWVVYNHGTFDVLIRTESGAKVVAFDGIVSIGGAIFLGDWLRELTGATLVGNGPA